MIPVSWDEILYRFAGSQQCYKLFINYILRLHVKPFIPTIRDPSFVQPGSRFAGMKSSHVIVSARLGEIKKLIIEDISIVSLRPIWRQSVRKKVNKYLCRISSFYRSSHQRCSAKKVFLKILQYSQENTCVGVSLRTFKSAILSKRNSNADAAKFLRTPILKNICERLLLILWKRIDTAENQTTQVKNF